MTRSAVTDAVAVVGAGTMGAGIAQVAAQAGHPVLLFDAVPGAAHQVAALIADRLDALLRKGKLTTCDGRVASVAALADLAGAAIVIEAVVEDLAVKRTLFADLEEVVAADCILATNTSSLSPTAIAAGLTHKHRFVGLHFFNPAPLMALVETSPASETSANTLAAATDLASSWGKTVVRASPTPGFIVNRLARPFYAEAWRLVEENAALPEVIDAVLVGAGGFRMGPFALMDLIGHDVNDAVTRSVWSAFGNDPRFAPSVAQRALIDAGRLGRKTGAGVFDYPLTEASVPAAAVPAPVGVLELGDAADLRVLLDRSGVPVTHRSAGDGVVELPGGASLVRCAGTTATLCAAVIGRPVVVVDRCLDDRSASAIAYAVSDGAPDEAAAETEGLLQAAGLQPYRIDDVAGLIVSRTVAMLVNLAVDALAGRVAKAGDIDTAMLLGTGSPLGPLAWGDRWGDAQSSRCSTTSRSITATVGTAPRRCCDDWSLAKECCPRGPQ